MQLSKMTRIQEGRTNIRPIEYPRYHEAYEASLATHWSPSKIPMSADLIDWSNATEFERIVIAGILKGFTLIESVIGCYWRNVVANAFPHPEIINMAVTFSATESVHLTGYDRLETTLGLDTYEAFTNDPVASKKLGDIVNQLDNPQSLALSLAIFSGACEGVSLFSSFAVLLSFSKSNKFKGLAAILSYSINEESLHSKMGIQLYQDLIAENPSLKPSEKEIHEGFDLVVQNELSFLEDVFQGGDLEYITKAAALDFVRFRANLKIMELGFRPAYDLDGTYKEIKFFFETITVGTVLHDFFTISASGSSYTATASQDFLSVTY